MRYAVGRFSDELFIVPRSHKLDIIHDFDIWQYSDSHLPGEVMNLHRGLNLIQ